MKYQLLNIVFFLIIISIQTAIAQPKSNFYADNTEIYSKNGKYLKVSNLSPENEKTSISDEVVKIDEYSISKYSKKGKELWTKKISLPNYYINLTEIKYDSKENIYLTGDFFERNSLKIGFYLIKMNQLGKVVWVKTFVHSENLNSHKFLSTIYITAKNDLVLISKAYPESETKFAQLNLYRFNSDGSLVSNAAAQISESLIGTSIDAKGNIFLLGSKYSEGNLSIDYIVSISEVKNEIKNIESNNFSVNESSFDLSSQKVKNIELKEIKLFCNYTVNGDLNLAYIKAPQKVLVKCIFNDNVEREEVNPNLFNTMEASISSNLWKDQRNLSMNSDFSGDIVFHIKNSSVKIENEFSSYYKQITKGVQKVKTKTYQIKNLDFLLYKVIQINTNSVIEPEVFE